MAPLTEGFMGISPLPIIVDWIWLVVQLKVVIFKYMYVIVLTLIIKVANNDNRATSKISDNNLCV